jgi:hypothetical protein
VRRALAAAVAGALAGAASLVIAFRLHPAVTMEMDRDRPRILTGFYDVERYREETFAWTSPRADVRLPDLDRRVEWQCTVRFRGGRPGGTPQPVVDLAIDGVTSSRITAPDLYQDVTVTAPSRPGGDGLQLTVVTQTPFVPGHGDTRQLGVQVDRIDCRPGAGARPSRRGLVAAALGGAAFGAGFAVVAGMAASVAGAVAIAVLQSVPLSTGEALYSPYIDRVPWIALWTVLPFALGAFAVRRRLTPAAAFAAAYSAAAAYLLLLALLHPSKSIVDAVFHAHRLEWVLGGRYFFTQPMPSGVSFPYAIALYVVAAPFSALTRDHVALLRIVVCAWQIGAGLLLYPAIARNWGDRLAAALAVVLFTLVPIGYMVVGNANLTNAFGQSAATIAMLVAATWPLPPGSPKRSEGWLGGAALFVVASIAFLSHVSIFPLLFVSLITFAALSMLGGRGTSAGNEADAGTRASFRASGRVVLVVSLAAAVFAVVIYYGHFTEVYRSLERVRSGAPVSAAAPEAAPSPGAATLPLPSIPGRAVAAVRLTIGALGWPITLLMFAGAWRLLRDGIRDRLSFAALGWTVAWGAFTAFGVLAPVEPRFWRYTVEFLDRVNYFACPVDVILAARGAAWGWRANIATRVVVTILLVAAAIVGLEHWTGWFGASFR